MLQMLQMSRNPQNTASGSDANNMPKLYSTQEVFYRKKIEELYCILRIIEKMQLWVKFQSEKVL